MKLQLADGFIEQPLGLLERVVVSSSNIAYEHTFAVVDFGKKPNYEIILGRPFMRQLKMIQDWGYNYLYLRQTNATTRIDLRDHSSKDVANTPARDYVSIVGDDTTPSWLIQQQPLWFCNPKDECKEDESEKCSDGYIPEPFPEHLLEPYGWQDILATLARKRLMLQNIVMTRVMNSTIKHHECHFGRRNLLRQIHRQ